MEDQSKENLICTEISGSGTFMNSLTLSLYMKFQIDPWVKSNKIMGRFLFY